MSRKSGLNAAQYISNRRPPLIMENVDEGFYDDFPP